MEKGTKEDVRQRKQEKSEHRNKGSFKSSETNIEKRRKKKRKCSLKTSISKNKRFSASKLLNRINRPIFFFFLLSCESFGRLDTNRTLH